MAKKTSTPKPNLTTRSRSKTELLKMLALLLLVTTGCAKDRPEEIEYDHEEVVVPQSMLEGKFYYAITMVDLTFHTATDFPGIQKSTVVELRRREDHVDFIDLASGLDKPNQSDTLPMASIEIDPVDITRKKDDNGEETHKIVMERKRPATERSHAIVKFSENDLDEIGLMPFSYFAFSAHKCYKPATYYGRVFDVEISEDSIHYSIEKVYERLASCQSEDILKYIRNNLKGKETEGNFKVVFKHSLLRVKENPSYKSKAYPEKDQRKVGLFATEISTFKEGLKEEKSYYVRRWDPTKKVTYVFSENFPEQLKPGIHEIFADINAHLKRVTGHDMLEIRDHTGKEKIGDIRYSMIVWVDKGTDGILGYGPSHGNPFTGELINANVFLYKTGFDSVLARLLETTRLAPITFAQEGNPQWDPNKGKMLMSSVAGKALPGSEEMALDPLYNHLVQYVRQEKIEREMGANPKTYLLPASDMEAEKALARAYAENNVYSLNEKALAHTSALLAADSKFASSPIDKEAIWKRLVLETFVHELLHTLGLRHNFKGSFDKKHHTVSVEEGYPKLPGALKERLVPGNRARSSTVMEYITDLQGAVRIGPYDKFALSYAYGEDSSSLAAKSNFLYCTDEDAFREMDPFCERFDVGTSAEEIVESTIADYFATYPLRNIRNDWNQYSPAFANTESGAIQYFTRIYFNTFYPLQRIVAYGSWINASKEIPVPMLNREALVADTDRAGKKIVSFLEQVLRDGDRPFANQIDEKNELYVQGIAIDKWAASFALFSSSNLLGDTPFTSIERHSFDEKSMYNLLLQIATNRLLDPSGNLTLKNFFPSHWTLHLRLAALYHALYLTAFREFYNPKAQLLTKELEIDLNYGNREDESDETIVSRPLPWFRKGSNTLLADKTTIAGKMIQTFNDLDIKIKAIEEYNKKLEIASSLPKAAKEDFVQKIKTVKESLAQYREKKEKEILLGEQGLLQAIEELVNLAKKHNVSVETTDRPMELINAIKEVLNDPKKTVDWNRVHELLPPEVEKLISEIESILNNSFGQTYLALLQEEGLVEKETKAEDIDLPKKMLELREKAARGHYEMQTILYNLYKFHPGSRTLSPYELNSGN